MSNVKSTKGLTVFMSGTTTPAKVVPTGISKAAPAVVTVADSTGMADGQVVSIIGSGFPELDGQLFIVGGLTATEFTLIGSDTTASTGTIGTTPEAVYVDDAKDMVGLCLSTIGINAETATPISVATFCDPTASIPGAEAGAGTLDLGFYVDIQSDGYKALLAAEADGNERIFKITFPGNGDLVMRGIVSSVTITDIPLDGSAAVTAQVTLSSKPKHRF